MLKMMNWRVIAFWTLIKETMISECYSQGKVTTLYYKVQYIEESIIKTNARDWDFSMPNTTLWNSYYCIKEGK